MAKKSVPATTYPDFSAALTRKEQQKMEQAAEGFGINRRIASILLTRSRQQLLTGGGEATPAEQSETLFMIERKITDYIDHLNSMQEMAKAAQARVFVTLQTMIDLAGTEARS